MQLVSTLIANTHTPLTDTTLDALIATLQTRGIRSRQQRWLSPTRACDLLVEGPDVTHIQAAVTHALGDLPVDVIVQPPERRRKRLLVADMDATIVDGETLDEVAALAGIGDAVSAITRRAMDGELDFEQALRQRVALLEGQPVSLLEDALARVQLNAGAHTLVQTMRAHGATCVLVSGGFRFFTRAVAAHVSFDHEMGNTLKTQGAKITGEVGVPVVDRAYKRTVLEHHRARLDLDPSAVLCVGDGNNDLDMLQVAGLAVGFRAKPSVQRQVPAQIRHSDLRALLYAQGYTDDEIAAAV